MAQNRIAKISLTEDDLEKLVRRLQGMIEVAEEFHSRYDELHNQYLNAYLCKPDVEEKLSPWPGASNLFVPLGRIMQDGIAAQQHEAMFSNDPYVSVVGMEDSDLPGAELLSKFYGEYVFKQLIRLPVFGNAWNFQTNLDGTGVIKHAWNKSHQVERELVSRLTPKYRDVTLSIAGEDRMSPELEGYDEFFEEEVRAVPQNRPDVWITDLTNIYLSPDTLPSENGLSGLQWPNCPWYYERLQLTWDELVSRRVHAGYENVNEELRSKAAKREPTENEATKRDSEGLSEYSSEEAIDVYEFYMRLVLPADIIMKGGARKKQSYGDEGGYAEDVIATYFPDTAKIARIVPLWRVYADGRRPHIPNWYNQLPLAFYGQGVQAKMRMLNAATNSSFNMMIDSGHIANVPWFFYSPSLTGILPEINSLVPGQGVPVNDPRGIQMPRFQTDQSWFLNVINQLQVFAERDTTVNDLVQGRDIQKKGASSTVRGTMALLQQSGIAFGRLISLMSLAYEEMFRAIHADYKRHAPDEILFRVMNDKRTSFQQMRIGRDVLGQDVDFRFILNPNKQQLIQNMQIMFQLMMSIPYVVQNPKAVRALAKQVYDASSTGTNATRFVDIWPEDMIPQMPGQPPMMPGQQQGLPQGPMQMPMPQGMPMGQGMPMPEPEGSTAEQPTDEEMGVSIQ